MIELVPYQESLRSEWDALVRSSRNGHFFFRRDFLDYHLDRFPSASFLFRDGKEWLGLVPGHLRGEDGWASHRGLTYGGLVLSPDARASQALEMMARLDEELRDLGIREARMRPLPWFHHDAPSQEVEYALFRLGAREESCVLTPLVPAGNRDFSQLRRRSMAKARKAGVTCGPGDDLEAFWPLVEARLGGRFGLKPAHTLGEMRLLKARFPEEIEFYEARLDGVLLAGCLTFRTPKVLHMQYLHASDQGRDLGASDLLVAWILEHACTPARWFCMGHSCEEDGHVLNEGLHAYKESLGGHAAVYREYLWHPQERKP